ncbi:MAG: hypothetical protein KGQ52_11505 [Alphaproteobacteria bacterium]|nr:hypothetical protein [Alphaproteobacteria bacterium]
MSRARLHPHLRRGVGNLFSSDVYQNYTATYAWASNQTAHLGLGCVVAMIALALCPWLAEHLWLMFLVYPAKEGLDVWLARRLRGSPFPVPLREILIDSATDLGFVSLGIALAVLQPLHPASLAAWAGVALAFAALASRHFIAGKRAFDKSALPYLFRLGGFRATWRDEADVIRAFLDGNGPPHLLLVGQRGSGRTTLAVAIGCELANRLQLVRHVSCPDLIEALTGRNHASRASEPWTVHEAGWLVVDHVDAGRKLPPLPPGKRIIWVASADADRPGLEAMLAAAGAGGLAVIDVTAMAYQPP